MKHDRTIRACSIWRALDVVGDVPVLLLMEQALLGIHSFDEFVARTGLARSVVNGRLKKLVEEDCLAKVPRKGGRGFHYVLTQKGRDQFPNGLMMLRWQHKWEADSRDFQVHLHHATCGHATEPVPTCGHCHAEIDPRDVDWREGPGLAQIVPHYERRRFNGEIGARRPGGRPLVDTMIELFGDRWATLVVRYTGAPISQVTLLRYVIALRNHQGFHEQIIEQVFTDILQQCQPRQLSVYGRFTRRGGLDINPFRSNFEVRPLNRRVVRQ